MNTCPSRIETASPGNPTIRLMNVPPTRQAALTWGGVLKTMMSPRSGSRNR